MVFMLPWLEATIAGTTDSSAEITMRPQPSEEEIRFILDSIAEYLTVKVRCLACMPRSVVHRALQCNIALVMGSHWLPTAGSRYTYNFQIPLHVCRQGLCILRYAAQHRCDGRTCRAHGLACAHWRWTRAPRTPRRRRGITLLSPTLMASSQSQVLLQTA